MDKSTKDAWDSLYDLYDRPVVDPYANYGSFRDLKDQEEAAARRREQDNRDKSK